MSSRKQNCKTGCSYCNVPCILPILLDFFLSIDSLLTTIDSQLHICAINKRAILLCVNAENESTEM
jgi:hypothetical protein